MFFLFSLDDGMRILLSFPIAFLWLLNLFSLPHIVLYGVSLQVLGVVTAMAKNYHERVLPRSRNGRRLATPAPSADSQLFKTPPPPPYSGESKHQLPNYKNYSLHGADISLDWGYNVVDAVQMTEAGFFVFLFCFKGGKMFLIVRYENM